MPVYNFFHLQSSTFDPDQRQRIVEECYRYVHCAVVSSLQEKNEKHQSTVLNMLTNLGKTACIGENFLYVCFRLTFYYMVETTSVVATEAEMCANEMCAAHNCTPMNMLDWYKNRVFDTCCRLIVAEYLGERINLERSLHHVRICFKYAQNRIKY